MSVAHDAISESHTGTTGVASVASFNWNHAGGGSARSALVFTLAIGANPVTGVTYNAVAMNAVAYTAYDSDTEPGFVQAWFLDNCGTGTKNIVVSRTNNAVVTYAVAMTQTADQPTVVYDAGVKTKSGSGAVQTAASSSNTGVSTFDQLAVADGSVGVDSLRYMAVYSGAGSVIAAGTATTSQSTGAAIDFGNYVFATYRQTSPSQGSFTFDLNSTGYASDDLAVIGLAIQENFAKPPAGLGSGTGTAQTPSVQVVVPGGLASATGTAHQPSGVGGAFPDAAVGSGTGTAQSPSVQTRFGGGLGSGTGTAGAPTPAVHILVGP